MFNLRFTPEYTTPNDQERSGGIDSSPVREAGSCSRKNVREALTVGPSVLSSQSSVIGIIRVHPSLLLIFTDN